MKMMRKRRWIQGLLLMWLVAGVLRGQQIVPLPAEVYEDVPFSMKQIGLPQFPDYRVEITDFGAVSSSHALNTVAINKAIRHVHDRGGGMVVIPAGLWITGPIELLSNVRLHAERNALVLFSPDYSLYKNPDSARTGNHRMQSPIHAYRAENIAITGEGIFDGNGDVWRMVKRGKMTDRQWQERLSRGGYVNAKGDQWWPNEQLARRDVRPNMVRLWECRNVLLQQVTFRNSPAWCVHPIHCEGLVIHGVSVINPWYSQNGDALDVESCDGVVIYDCTIDAGDDAICLKSGKDAPGRKRGWPCRNVIARDNVVYHGHGGFVVGSEMSGGVQNVLIDNCTFIGTDVGLRFKSTRGRGGVVENIHCRRINMFDIAGENILFDLFYAVKGADYSRREPVSEETPAFRDIHISDVKGVGGRRAIYFNGLPEMPIRRIHLKDISFTGTRQGAFLRQAEEVTLENVRLAPLEGSSVTLQHVSNITIDGQKIESVGEEKKIVE
ncbi:MAG: glycoside hydrolase family 28 protein [Bacteroidaceae bacterium]|nr:glycoside hydrolase family 28 protein [Bacteroidaceae bacterium]